MREIEHLSLSSNRRHHLFAGWYHSGSVKRVVVTLADITSTRSGCSAIGVVTVSGRALFIHAANAIFSLCAKCGRTLVQLPPSIILERGLYPVVSRDRSALTVAAVSLKT